MPPEPQRIDPEEGPWEANLCFTVKAQSKEDVDRLIDRINTATTRLGCGVGFSDYEGSQLQPEDGPDR